MPMKTQRSSGASHLGLSALLVVLALGDVACRTNSPCCTAPVVDEDVPLTWTVGGHLAATGCPMAQGALVEVEILGPGASTTGTFACAAGQGLLRATLFGELSWSKSAGTAFVRLLDAQGTELSAVRVPLAWAQGQVGLVADLALATPGGTLRYQSCQAIAAGAIATFTLDGPMYRVVTVPAPATDVRVEALAPGAYGLSAIGLPHDRGIDQTVTIGDGLETLVTFPLCP
jgi:hypothetical protein